MPTASNLDNICDFPVYAEYKAYPNLLTRLLQSFSDADLSVHFEG